MPSDEYTSVARGPLKLKGAAGVTKKKKKKDKDKSGARTDLERNLSTGDGDGALARKPSEPPDRRPSAEPSDAQEVQGVEAELEDPDSTKTEAERRFAEAKRKRLRELAESARSRPELLKTHKQRVEELNAHLARLSEHHDMPKIGPG